MRLVVYLGFLAALIVPVPAEDLPPGNFGDSLARLLSADVRAADRRLVSLNKELAELPALDWAHESPRHGFHSASLFEQEEPEWIQIDLQGQYPIDMIAIMGADVRTPEGPETAHAFPLRFKVEVSSREDMSDARLLVNETSADVVNPGRFPLVYERGRPTARYLRFTSTKHWPTRNGDFIWAVGEIMVLSGDRNVALGRPVSASSRGLELEPNWMLMAVNDGHSIVGTPVSNEPSPTYGFRSSNAEHDAALRWVTVDLGEVYQLSEVRLIPAWPSAFAYEAGMGFPRSLKVLLSTDERFRNSFQLNGDDRPGNARNNPYTIRVPGHRGRYLRVEASRLWKQGDLLLFAFAELQAYADGKNVAEGKAVIANDTMEEGDFSRWAPEFLVDGYSSKSRLVPWREYFRTLVSRRSLEEEKQELEESRNERARGVADFAVLTGSGLSGAALIALFLVTIRQRTVRLRDRMRLREQIARDLHDELGSDLGSISLLSELGSRVEDLPEDVRNDFSEIHKTAERSAEAMRDIVWLIDSGASTLRELVAKMREAAERLVGDIVNLKVIPEEVQDRELPLLFRRHALFSFKESLNNIRRHARAEKVEITIDCHGGALAFTIRDDGVGFRVDERLGLGNGLENLRSRAQKINGRCEIASEPGEGTTIQFEAPLTIKNHAGANGAEHASLAG